MVVTHTPDVLTGEVADLALGLLIATVRQMPQVDRYLREGKWLKGAYPLTATLRERKVGILGLGRIGKAIAKRLEACDLEIEYHGRKPQADVKYRYHPTLLGLAKSCDVLMVVASGGAETKHMVNKEVLDALGPNGILINVGRGSVVDEAALVKALQDKTHPQRRARRVRGRTQVPAELVAIDHVVLLPHVGSASVHTRNAMGQLVVDNLVSWFGGKGAITPCPNARRWRRAKPKADAMSAARLVALDWGTTALRAYCWGRVVPCWNSARSPGASCTCRKAARMRRCKASPAIG